ncbi:UDP-3-O-(3-hydroxymyristoyl)glucosamine N-acyltransferase [PVC group bacterium]|nr:UDP-3-O-(3-hydroxymyristoyl)glucosamine N-acyltransferase [PVC group bacterium]
MKKRQISENQIKKRLADIAELVDGHIQGDENLTIYGVANIEDASAKYITFATDSEHLEKAEQTEASAIIVPEEITSSKKAILRVKNPRLAIAQVINIFHPPPKPVPGIHPKAVIGQNTKIDPSAFIDAYSVIGSDCQIGPESIIYSHVTIRDQVQIAANCIIHPHVTIYPKCIIASNVILHAGVVIGSDGFGYVEKDSIHYKVPQVGNVIIESYVEIGANTCIDCATMGSTVIRQGTKIDNLVQIAHNNQIGKNCIIISQTGISGSVQLGENVVIAGQVGIKDHVKIGDRAMVIATSVVSNDLEGRQIYAGVPAKPFSEAKRRWASIALLPKFMKKLNVLPDIVKQLEDRMAKLEEFFKAKKSLF